MQQLFHSWDWTTSSQRCTSTRNSSFSSSSLHYPVSYSTYATISVKSIRFIRRISSAHLNKCLRTHETWTMSSGPLSLSLFDKFKGSLESPTTDLDDELLLDVCRSIIRRRIENEHWLWWCSWHVVWNSPLSSPLGKSISLRVWRRVNNCSTHRPSRHWKTSSNASNSTANYVHGRFVCLIFFPTELVRRLIDLLYK